MRKSLGSALFAAAMLFGCRVDPLTSDEAKDDVEESSVDSQASALTSASVQVSTDITIGDRVEKRPRITSASSCNRNCHAQTSAWTARH